MDLILELLQLIGWVIVLLVILMIAGGTIAVLAATVAALAPCAVPIGIGVIILLILAGLAMNA